MQTRQNSRPARIAQCRTFGPGNQSPLKKTGRFCLFQRTAPYHIYKIDTFPCKICLSAKGNLNYNMIYTEKWRAHGHETDAECFDQISCRRGAGGPAVVPGGRNDLLSKWMAINGSSFSPHGGLRDHSFLQSGKFFKGNFNAKVAPCNHYTV